jgi:hypothetical protein
MSTCHGLKHMVQWTLRSLSSDHCKKVNGIMLGSRRGHKTIGHFVEVAVQLQRRYARTENLHVVSNHQIRRTS